MAGARLIEPRLDGRIAPPQRTPLARPPRLEAPQEDVPFVVVRKVALTPTIVELDLAPLQECITHQAGQYVLIGDPDFRVPQRSYSVANSARADGAVRLLVTEVAGGETSSWIHGPLQAGDSVLLSGPYGTFVDEPSWTGPILHLAGGSGLAPILALVETQVAEQAPRQIDVLFSAAHPTDVYLRDVFRRWEKGNPTFRFHRTLTRSVGPPPRGRIPEVLPRLFPDLSGHLVFVAGSAGLVDACAAATIAGGGLHSRVRTEAFFTEPQPWHTPAAPTSHHRA